MQRGERLRRQQANRDGWACPGPSWRPPGAGAPGELREEPARVLAALRAGAGAAPHAQGHHGARAPPPSSPPPTRMLPRSPEGRMGARSGSLRPLAQPRWTPEQPLREDRRALSPLPRDAGPSRDCRTPQVSTDAQCAEMTTASGIDGKRPAGLGAGLSEPEHLPPTRGPEADALPRRGIGRRATLALPEPSAQKHGHLTAPCCPAQHRPPGPGAWTGMATACRRPHARGAAPGAASQGPCARGAGEAPAGRSELT